MGKALERVVGWMHPRKTYSSSVQLVVLRLEELINAFQPLSSDCYHGTLSRQLC